MSEQRWWCEKCGASGSVPVEDGDDVMAVVNRIDAAHQEHPSAVNCTAGVCELRVEAADAPDAGRGG